MIGTAVVIIASCLLSEAFFSGAELALISADKVRLRHLADGEVGARRQRMILSFLDQPGDLISAALTGTNICVVLSTVTATVALLTVVPQQAELVSLAVMAPLVLIFGEIVPKSVFQHYADTLAPKLIYILSGFRLIFLPLVVLGSRLSSVILRLMRLEAVRSLMTRDELRLLIRLPSRPGADRISAHERKMIGRIFDFKNTKVEQIMVPLSEVAAVSDERLAREVAGVIAEQQHTRLPVFRGRVDQIVGIVHGFDVLRAGPETPIQEICRPAVFVPDGQPAVDTLVLLQREGQHMAAVVDEYGGAIGVVTIEDILEEIVGEIPDEFDPDDSRELIRRDGEAFVVLGRAAVDLVNEATSLQLPVSEEYETIAGLVLDKTKRIPVVGERVRLPMAVLTVSKATERSVEEVRIERGRRRQ